MIEFLLTKDMEKYRNKLFYIKLWDDCDNQGYLNLLKNGNELKNGTRYYTQGVQTQFTIEEILAIDPRYLLFAVLVDDDN